MAAAAREGKIVVESTATSLPPTTSYTTFFEGVPVDVAGAGTAAVGTGADGAASTVPVPGTRYASSAAVMVLMYASTSPASFCVSAAKAVGSLARSRKHFSGGSAPRSWSEARASPVLHAVLVGSVLQAVLRNPRAELRESSETALFRRLGGVTQGDSRRRLLRSEGGVPQGETRRRLHGDWRRAACPQVSPSILAGRGSMSPWLRLRRSKPSPWLRLLVELTGSD